MKRIEIIDRIGAKYNVGNIESGEFSYSIALKSIGKNIKDYQKATSGSQHQYLDIKFENERLSILVECKNKFSKWDKFKIQKQLQDYVRFEKAYSDKKIVAILVETEGDDLWVWYGQSVIIDEEHRINEETKLKTFEEYEEICFGKVNDKIKVIDAIKILNEKLHSDGVNEKLRSQFVGTCLLALKNGLVYENVKETINASTGKSLKSADVVLNGIKNILEGLLTKSGSLNKASKLAVLNNKVLDDQDIQSLTYAELSDILKFIDNNIIPFINDKNTAGQDLLNLFFTTFNKYVGKSDKNQAFTPDHICGFMSKVIGVNKHSRVLDPCCGSGAFLVRAMTDAMDDCETEDERELVKREQIFGIEYEEGAFGLSSTNMLIHGDGNSNVVQDSLFNRAKWIENSNINRVLMNPPYNATKKFCNPEYTKNWDSKKKEDPSKGFHFVEWVARHVSPHCKLAVLLPMQAAIGNSGEVKEFKKKMLENYTLEAVFSLPVEIFYPGAAAVAVCMVFDLSQKHEKVNKETFFGYYRDDKFTKRKGLGRIELTDDNGNSLWAKAEEIWLDLYKNRKAVPGLSVMKKITFNDEWLAEAYMETDYSALETADFQKVLNSHLAYLVKEGNVYED
ncbi:HsdM family class I SAM-dependent methyltransferase [Flavobacterium pallidum]|uniref:site-specific DNA-methyltransferase (adenine-specific) n=1 Tax=Flavobacterium pallidum TaxID=2172098 RepID=A0A2S1SIT9_9FLAO|nr:N-6 DNA methylase [Flavobacterium pallidum]AWI26333.1 SAM-dependent methyltransferase [Flavobacterium pallidum]